MQDIYYRKNQVAYTNPSEILFLSLLAVISGANSFEDMSFWMKERKREIAKFLEKPFKAPAYTTIRNTFLHIIRSHWKIENSLHCVKDVSFEEDACRTRTAQIPFVQTMIRNLLLTLSILTNSPALNKLENSLLGVLIGFLIYKVFFFRV